MDATPECSVLLLTSAGKIIPPNNNCMVSSLQSLIRSEIGGYGLLATAIEARGNSLVMFCYGNQHTGNNLWELPDDHTSNN